MYDPDCALVTLKDIEEARQIQGASAHCVRTPLLKNMQNMLPVPQPVSALRLKLENTQVTGTSVLSLFLCSLSYLICNLFYPRTVCMIFF
jgi:hypothetical protein